MTTPQPIPITPIATVVGGHTEVLDDYQGGVQSIIHARSPRNNPRWPATGPFAHRNHRRLNQLAISYPRLLGIDGRDLLVTDLDAVDGTPVVDIGAYFTAMGPRGPVREPAWPGEMLTNYWADADSR
ncbi:TrmO family methyltransferase (plasmid) [Streptomyces globisporus]|uniref:TrmO family methyltransferase domain-containing protein n=1 Tax=Streptomyces globisporus TaxID=1908 RepID=UPI002F9158F7|nr:TrmO family methyltransferase [Streptomyces globisporus]